MRIELNIPRVLSLLKPSQTFATQPFSDATFPAFLSRFLPAGRPPGHGQQLQPVQGATGMFSFHREFRSRPGRIVRKSRTPARFALVAALLAAGSVYPVAAQTTFATITGTVTDPGGAIVPNAKIEVVHVASNYRYETQSNSVGNYTLAQLRDGEYTLRATAPGFSSFEAKEIQLSARDVRRLDIALTVGTVQTAVEVTAGATV